MTTPLPPLLLRGDCLVELARIPDASVDAIVTDPPYNLTAGKKGGTGDASVNLDTPYGRSRITTGGGFMGQKWDDYDTFETSEGGGFQHWCEVWSRECLRILKPGGHMLAFGGSRTWHRLAAGIEDAGFEIRDSIAWLYGSGFPKSMDVSKAIDKLDAADERRARALTFTAWMRSTGMTAKRIDEITGTAMGSHYTTHPTQPHIATAELFDMLRPYLPEVPEGVERLVAERTVESQNYAARRVTGTHEKTAPGQNMQALGGKVPKMVDPERRDEAHTDAAREWQGWGTALKPAFEPIVVARKPLSVAGRNATVAANVLAHGTGALNIDATRIENADYDPTKIQRQSAATSGMMGLGASGYHADHEQPTYNAAGRWPANVVLDEDQAAALDAQAPKTGAAARASGKTRTGRHESNSRAGAFNGTDAEAPFYDVVLGGASRFFYVAKAPKSERPVVDGTAHPTVKPLALMRWLCRLVTPAGGVVVDPFAGSGTTLEAAYLEGFESIGVELTPDFWPLIEARIARATGDAS